MFKTVGQPCKDCGVPYIAGVKGAYCKPCYIKWKNGTQAPVSPQNAPQSSFNPLQATVDDLQQKVDALNQVIANMRVAFQNHEDRIKSIETPIEIPVIEPTKLNFDLPEGFLQP